MATEEQKSTDDQRGDAEPGDEQRKAAPAVDETDGDEDEGSDSTESSSDEEDEERAEAAPASRDDDDRDEDDDEGDAGEAAAASAGAASAGAGAATAATKKAPVRAGSAGARLAAAKAAKAAKKAARKAREQAEAGAVPAGMTGGASKPAEEVLAESAIGQAATKASEWAQSNRPIAMGIAAVAIVAILGYAGWAWYGASQAHAAGALLAEAVEIANAEIVAEGSTDASADEEGADEEPTFPTRQARAEAALEAYGQVVSQHGGTEAARWARLGQAWAHFELGHMDEAREAYEQTFRDAGGDPVVAWRALEGMGFTYEAAQQWDEAIEKYEELSHIEDGAYSAAADYHIARMRIAKGETVEATTALRALVERLRSESEDGEPEFPYVLAQAEIRLRELDPTAAGGSSAPMMIGPGGEGGGGLPAGLDGLPPEILEQLRRQLQEGGGAPGGGGGAGGAGGGGEGGGGE